MGKLTHIKFSPTQWKFLKAAAGGIIIPLKEEWRGARILAAEGLVSWNMDTSEFAITDAGRLALAQEHQE